ncbi:MAG: lipopolysaccharide biosynthesis protein [Mariprofundaceae bacterium]
MRESVGFSAAGSMGVKIVSLLGFIVLARLLSPHEFGLMAMIAIFTALATILIELGMDSALIHNQRATDRHYSTAFWVNLLMGAVFCLLMVAAAGQIASFFNADELANVAKVSAMVFILNSLAIVPFALIKKRRQFRLVARVEVVSTVCGLVVAMVMAFLGYGVWALVANLLVVALVQVVLCFMFAHWHPQWNWGRVELAELWSYSGYLIGTNIFNYAVRNIDNLLVGKMLGIQALGAYKYAFQIASMPTALVAGVFNRVFFSSYSEFRDDKPRIKSMHLKASRLIAFLLFPAMLGLGVIADYFVLAVLGEKWIQMGYILSFFAIIMLFNSVGVMNSVLYLSQGKTSFQFKVTVFLRINVILGIVIGIQYGLDGLLWGYLIAYLINIGPAFYFSGKLVGISLVDVASNLGSVVTSSLLMAAIIYAVREMASLEPGSIVSLMVLILVGAVSYTLISFLLQRKLCREVLDEMKPWPGRA